MPGKDPSRSTAELRVSKAEAPHDLHDSKHHQAGGCMLPSIAAQKAGAGQQCDGAQNEDQNTIGQQRTATVHEGPSARSTQERPHYGVGPRFG